MNMRHEALACMREMLYSSLYSGAGSWFTKRVLIVDDSKVMRTFLKRLLQGKGYATDEACNGVEALALMKRRFYDCVFIDLEMPVMDGACVQFVCGEGSSRLVGRRDWDLKGIAFSSRIPFSPVVWNPYES